MSILVVKVLENLLSRSCNFWSFIAISFDMEGLPQVACILRCVTWRIVRCFMLQFYTCSCPTVAVILFDEKAYK